ncbi:1-phosphofructokinase [Suttonella sp. R2A3]|uniref:1-phosphofructokinase n=1 Tax=Suttonella sp. R2A3 TaxID=2908648 RepID=UPI001F36F206|nr:1-phosphofructokinase [Suttonella sp. R2A3]UJF24702.1 1-phosphofructokinase [Suttonella sp. R2A3]
MSKIITVTPNPALDLTMHAKGWQRGVVNRGQSMDVTPGGKGLTVAINLAMVGVPCTVTGWMGQNNDGHFCREFNKNGLEDQFVRVPGDVRRNIKIVDESNGETTDINMPGHSVSEAARTLLIELIDAMVDEETILVYGGSLPPDLEKSYYADMVKRYHDRTRAVVVDTSDEALDELMKADILPQVIKPNIHELENLVGRTLESDADIIAEARRFIDKGVELAVVSLGSRGAWFVRKDEALHAQPPKVKVASTVGAGDAMVAGIVRGIMFGRTLEEIARTSTSYSVANIKKVGISLPSIAEIEEIKAKVVITHQA